MFKVSFKETNNCPSKAIVKTTKDTEIILKGIVKLPSFWSSVPSEIFNWIAEQHKVEIYENVATSTLNIYSRGFTKCKEGDKYDSILGERLAESRAKTNIYKFFYTLCYKLYNYYSRILYGSEAVTAKGEGGSLERTLYKYEKLYRRELEHLEELLNTKKQ